MALQDGQRKAAAAGPPDSAATEPGPRKNLYYPELDSLRFLAFLLVLVQHCNYSRSLRIWGTIHAYGWMGVDLFLCLSAFMFARLLYVEFRERGDINVRYFYLRRGLRIWPLYYFFFLAMLAYSLHRQGSDAGLWTRALGMATFTDNLFSMSLGYNVAILFSTHLWTISYEEQFYAIIPWTLRGLYRTDRSTAAWLLGSFLVIGSLIRAALIDRHAPHPIIWVFPLTHFESILGGLVVGLGLFEAWLRKVPGWALLLAGIAALCGVTGLPNVYVIRWGLMLTYPLLGIGMSLVLAGVLRGGLGPLSKFLRSRMLRYLGKISYGLYVYHLLCVPIALKIAMRVVSGSHRLLFPTLALLTTLLLTILISMLSYHRLEKPFLKWKERFTFVPSRPI